MRGIGLQAFIPIAQNNPPPIEQTRTCGLDPSAICENVLDLTGSELLAEIAEWAAGPLLRILVIVVGALVLGRIVRRFIKRALRAAASDRTQSRLRAARRMAPAALANTDANNERAAKRLEALTTLLGSMGWVMVAMIASFLILGELGIKLAPLLAGAGIAGIAIGFGAQSLVRDFLSGIFVLVEDQYGVGDIVEIGGVRGTVESISLLTTRLRGIDGTTWHVPNGEITTVGNMSQHWARALLDIEVAYDTDIAHAREVIKRVADEVWKENDAVIDEPEIWGVETLGASGVMIRFIVKTLPAEQWRIGRELRERIKAGFDAEGIEIPFPQQAVWFRGRSGDLAPGEDGEMPPLREAGGASATATRETISHERAPGNGRGGGEPGGAGGPGPGGGGGGAGG